MDENPLPGYSYYRLKQTDYDGHTGYSEIRTIKFKSAGNNESYPVIISTAPNPFHDKFTLSFILKTATVVDFQLMNTSGQIVFKDVISTTDGMNQYEFNDVKELPAGIYFVTLIYNGKKTTCKIIEN